MARYTSDHAQATREKILNAATRAFKEGGLDTVGIGPLMGKAGLTHGGFYAHFSSKDALVQETLTRSLRSTASTLLQAATNTAPYGLGGVVRQYVSRGHRDQVDAAGSCILPTLTPELTRHAPDIRHTFTATLLGMIDDLCALSHADTPEARRAEVLPVLSGMVGSVMLARAVTDRDLSDALLKTTRDHLISTLTPETPHE